MRVLWFTNTPSCYDEKGNDYNGGGWISSLEKEFRREYSRNIELGICFYHNKEEKVVHEGVTYYPILRRKTWLSSLKQLLCNGKRASLLHKKESLGKLVDVVNDFHPDIIQVFGTENIFGELNSVVKAPIVLHIQGILAPYNHAFLPPKVSWLKYVLSNRRLKSIFNTYCEKKVWERNAIIEERIYKGVKYFMGRTLWDKSVVSLMNPNAKYYYCSEILRDVFYKTNGGARSIPHKPVFISVVSWQIYKGMDVILRTAALLKSFSELDFEWHVYGNSGTAFAEKLTGIKADDVNVVFKGVVNADVLKTALMNCTAYVHASYIENSSNAICEAQISGCTCIATNVGGTSSLIKDGESGFLVPANDPYRLAYLMKYISYNRNENERIGNTAFVLAHDRHNKQDIASCVVEIYNDILSNQNTKE